MPAWTLAIALALTGSTALGPLPSQPLERNSTSSDIILLGDSVMAGMSRSEQGKAYLGMRFRYIFGAVGCQRLLAEGCMEMSKESAFDYFQRSIKRVNRAVVIATGYNDYNSSSMFRQAITRFTTAAERHGIIVVWLTYMERGNVKLKARNFNAVLREQDKRIENLYVLDWNRMSAKQADWYAADGVHLRGIGPLKMSQAIANYLTDLDRQGLLPNVASG
jgi:hypothetical protein